MTNPIVAGFNIYFGGASGVYTNKTSVGNATSLTISNLLNGSTYYFAATTYSAMGAESALSSEVSYTVPAVGSPGNQAPTLNALNNVTVNENAGAQSVNLSGISSGSVNEVQTLTVTATSSNPALIPNPTVAYTSPNASGSLAFTPAPNATGSAIITVTVNDGGASNNIVTRSFTVIVSAVNQAPTLNALNNLTLNENTGAQTVNLSGITSGSVNEVQTLTVTATSSNPALIPKPTVTYTSPNATGSLVFTPAANASGATIITVTVNDGGASNNIVTRSFTVIVSAVNQAPTLNALNNVTVNENTGAQSVNLSGITSGSVNEVQTLTVTATSSNPALIPNPTVTYTSPNATGSLAFTPAANAIGSDIITVTVNDGGASNNIVTRSFTVTVNAVNQAPTLNALNNVTVNENAGAQSVNLSGITSGSVNEVQTLTVTATSSNPALIPKPTVTYTSPGTTGSLTFTPAANASGSAIITVTVNDGGASNNIVTKSFTVTVNAVNQAPTLNALNNVTMNENAGAQSVNLSGISSGSANEVQTLTVTATSSNPALIPNPAVAYTSPNATGSLAFTPAPNATGSAIITVTVNDGGASNNIVTKSFTVTVQAVTPQIINDITKPTLSIMSPTPNLQWSNATLTATGRAADNVAVATVF